MIEQFVHKRFRSDALDLIDKANAILREYASQGFVLTLRQLFYQFVARVMLENSVAEYKRLGRVVADARRAGLIDWDHIEDRTRGLVSYSAWDSPAEILGSAAASYRQDVWEHQAVRPETWIEKSALSGVIKPTSDRWRTPFMAARGYPSHSTLYEAGRRLRAQIESGQRPVIFHLGDHDPSGLDMTRSLEAEVSLYAGAKIEVVRLGLNIEQIQEMRLPPNPAKETDKRYAEYVRATGCTESWELDAVPPAVIQRLLDEAISGCVHMDTWNAAMEDEAKNRSKLEWLAENWEAV